MLFFSPAGTPFSLLLRKQPVASKILFECVFCFIFTFQQSLQPNQVSKPADIPVLQNLNDNCASGEEVSQLSVLTLALVTDKRRIPRLKTADFYPTVLSVFIDSTYCNTSITVL